ncbi:unnamed protein product [Linum tenue]|uniref:N-acetyltransferase domain-containing protein n=1 Tax=Linum tenue TaxID=586396 RepID=A0AAV0HIN1_9ROSI|nr:unnamed protein product [Linum tenue]
MVKPIILRSVVGTLDLSIRWLLLGEIFPGVYGKAPHLGNIHGGGEDIYGYVSNLVVVEFARRRVELLYVHVDRNNRPAQQFYEKTGFEVSPVANHLSVAA